MIKKSRNYVEDLSITVQGTTNEESLQIANLIKWKTSLAGLKLKCFMANIFKQLMNSSIV